MNKKQFFSQLMAEFIGTFFMILFGCGSMAIVEINPSALPAFTIPVIFGGIIATMIYAVGHISGAHFNPAVTAAFFFLKRISSKKMIGYICSQFLGAIVATLIISIIWKNNHHFGATFVQTELMPALIIEFLCSFLLMFVIVAVATDSRAIGELAGIAIGLTVSLCAFVFGPYTGASMNPARSFAPALFNGNFEHLWIYLLVPILGTITAAFVYEKIRCDIKKNGNEHGCC